MSPRALVIATAGRRQQTRTSLFTGGYGPAPLTTEERAAIAAPLKPPPSWVTGEYQEWLEDELIRRFGAALAAEMTAMTGRAPVDLRVNTLKSSPGAVLAALAGRADFAAEAEARGRFAHSPVAPPADRTSTMQSRSFRILRRFRNSGFGRADGCRTRHGKAGHAGAGSGGRGGWKNFGPGGGDGEPGARSLPQWTYAGPPWPNWKRRAARAGVDIIRTHILGDPPLVGVPAGPFDLVLVDMPCSGSGTWRRQPELKWRLTPQRLAALTALQDRLLEQARPAAYLARAARRSMPPAQSCRWKMKTGWRLSWPKTPLFGGRSRIFRHLQRLRGWTDFMPLSSFGNPDAWPFQGRELTKVPAMRVRSVIPDFASSWRRRCCSLVRLLPPPRRAGLCRGAASRVAKPRPPLRAAPSTSTI